MCADRYGARRAASAARRIVAALVCAGLVACGRVGQAPADAPTPAPPSAALYTASGSVHALAVDTSGNLWAATGGGILCWPSDAAAPRRWTVADGLPSDDAHALRKMPAGMEVTFPVGACQISPAGAVTADGAKPPAEQELTVDGRFIGLPTSPALLGTVTGTARVGRAVYLASSLGLWRWVEGHWISLPLPPGSTASHVSALCTDDQGGVVAALYGDGLYRLTGTQWTRLTAGFSDEALVTALCETPNGLAAGTRADGVWRQADGAWSHCADGAALPSGDIESLAGYGGSLWAGTLDCGLLQWDGTRFRCWTVADGLGENTPRGMAVFGGRLYVRYATGEADCYDGTSWRPAFSHADLPRPEVYVLASDGVRLYIGGWAGWAATDGKTWERHQQDAALAGQVVTAIASAPDGSVWLGTQKAGLLRYQNGVYQRYQEPQGLTDDWITSLAVGSGRVLVGTYTGGLLELHGQRLTPIFDTQRFAVRSIQFLPGSAQAVIATPLGVYEEGANGWSLLSSRACGGLETQAILPAGNGLWVGSRTGLAYVPQPAALAVGADNKKTAGS